MKIQIRNDVRAVFVGATGSGKSQLAKHFLPRLNRVVVIDPKHTFKLPGFEVRKNLPLMGSKFRIVYRPGRNDDEHLTSFLYDLLHGRNCTIYCDELSTLSEQFPAATDQLADIARTGRELHVAVWSTVQRPRWVPRVFFTEAEIVFLFNLRSAEDRDYMSQFVGPEGREPIERFSFWYSHADADEPDPALMRLNLSKNYIEKIG